MSNDSIAFFPNTALWDLQVTFCRLDRLPNHYVNFYTLCFGCRDVRTHSLIVVEFIGSRIYSSIKQTRKKYKALLMMQHKAT